VPAPLFGVHVLSRHKPAWFVGSNWQESELRWPKTFIYLVELSPIGRVSRKIDISLGSLDEK